MTDIKKRVFKRPVLEETTETKRPPLKKRSLEDTETKKPEPVTPKRRGRPPKASKDVKIKRVNIGVSIDESLWRRLKALAITQGVNTGELLDKAIKDYLDKHK